MSGAVQDPVGKAAVTAPGREPERKRAGARFDPQLSRPLSDAVAQLGSARTSGTVLLGAGALVAALLGIQGMPGESRSAAAPEPVRVRGAAPPNEALAEVEAEAKAGVGRGSKAQAEEAQETSPVTEAVVLELQRQALAGAEARRRAGEEARKRELERMRSPIVLFDEAGRVPGDLGGGSEERELEERLDLARGSRAGAGGGLPPPDRTLRARARTGSRGAAAQRIESPSTTLTEGTLIQGVLETAIQSDLPGRMRAQVSSPAYAFDGTLLIPRGSRLMGEYESGLVRGQTRVFVLWTRLLRPDGTWVRLDSPGTDALGRAGLGGAVDTHFFEIFGSGMLLSVLGGGLDIAAASAQDGARVVVQGGGGDLRRAAEIALENRVSIAPTVHVAAGTAIQVVVAADLDVGAPPARLD